MIVLYILLFILILCLVVCVHELGHYFFAKKANILVNEFAFGMGPKLYSKKKGETVWSIRALPLGGFCAMAGEEASTPLIKVGDSVRLVFDELNKVKQIIVSKEDPNYVDELLVNVEKIDLWGANMSELYINDYAVNRDAMIILSKKESLQVAPEERSFASKKAWQRFLVCFGGPLNNILLALFVFILMSFIVGVADTESNIVGSVSKDSPAYISGIQKGDEIININGYEINEWTDINESLSTNEDRKNIIIYKRNGVEYTTNVYFMYIFQNLGFSSTLDDNSDKVIITVENEAALGGTNKTYAYQKGGLRNGDEVVGVIYNDIEYNVSSWNDVYKISTEIVDGGSIQIKYVRNSIESISDKYEVYSNELLESQGYYNAYKQLGLLSDSTIKFFPCLLNGLRYFANSASLIFSTLWLLLTSKEVGVKDLGGFITILNQTAQYAKAGFTDILYFIGLLSVNLGIINLLPIPALDGGKIVFIGIEGITKKKINQRVQTIIENIVFWLLMALIVYILFQDVFRLVIQLK